MAPDLVQIRELAGRKEEENSRFRQFLRTACRLEPGEIDQRESLRPPGGCGPESTAPLVATVAEK
jgi:hypothetical protein